MGTDTRSETDVNRRLIGLLGSVIALITIYSLVYRWGMATFEAETVPLYQALQVVIESITTAGFGGHAPWDSLFMNLLVLTMNLTGVFLVFLALPLVVVPMLRNALDREPPRTTNLTNHVIICGHSPMDDVLSAELRDADVPFVFVESDREKVLELMDLDVPVIFGNPERVETLKNANAGDARALVADLDDETTPTVILSADRVNPNLHIVSVVQNSDAIPHHRFAGADDVVVSKESLGESLARRAMETVSERFKEVLEVKTDLKFTEYLVEEDSPLVGKSIDSIDAFDELGIRIIGGWFGARFLISPHPSTEIVPYTILLLSTDLDSLEELGIRALPSHHGHPSRVVVCGYGDAGQAATKTLREENIDVTVIDSKGMDGVDVIGDITRLDTLQRARVADARSVVIAVNDDPTAIYTAILINQFAPDVEVIVRANDFENIWKLYNGGADYVLSLPTVTGEILASTLIGEEILTPTDNFEFVRSEAPNLVGSTLAEADVRNKTGATVVGVERDGTLLTKVGPTFTVEAGDALIAAGSEGAISRFENLVAG